MEKKLLKSVLANKGFSVVEVLIAFVVFSLVVASLTSAYVLFFKAQSLSGERTSAVFLAEEGLEALRNIADEDFSNLVDGTHGLATSSNVWTLLGAQDTSGKYLRQLTISTVDADTKKAVSQVSWANYKGETSTVSFSTLFTYWDQLAMLEKFWSNATTSAIFDLAGNDNGIKVQISGNYAFIVRTSGNPRFSIIEISDPYVPTSISNPSLGSASPMNIFISGNYAYVVGTQNNPEFQVVDISDPASASVVGTYNANRNTDAYGVYAVGNYAYMTRLNSTDPEFYIIDVSNPASPNLTGSLNLNGSAREVAVSGNYAYIASTDNAQELQVVDVSSPASPSLVGSLDLSGNTDAYAVSALGTTVLVGQGNDLRIIDVSNPVIPTLMGSFSAGGVINDVGVNLANGNTYVFLATDSALEEFQIVDISTPATPVLLKSLDVSGALNGVAYDSGLDTSVGVSSDNNGEVVIFIPQ